MGMDKIDGSAFLRPGQLDRFQGTERSRAEKNAADERANSPTSAGAEALRDKAEISPTARRMVHLRRAVDEGRVAMAEAPDPRRERVEQVRQRLDQGFYESAAVRERVADGVFRVFASLEEM